MKATIKTTFGTEGQYLKSDRTSTHSILMQLSNGKKYWIMPVDITSATYGASVMSAEKFCSLLRIPF